MGSRLNAIEYAQKVNGREDRRHCITHIFLVDPNDIHRFKDMGVVAMLNSYWAQIDETYFVNGTYTGMDRIAHTYPINSFFKSGCVVANASDYPITAVPNPFVACIEDMIDSFTIAQAYANFVDDVSGSIEVGKEADIIVVDQNVLTCKSEDIGLAQVERTLFRGETLYKK